MNESHGKVIKIKGFPETSEVKLSVSKNAHPAQPHRLRHAGLDSPHAFIF